MKKKKAEIEKEDPENRYKITLTFDQSLIDRIDQHGQRLGLNRAQTARYLLQSGLERAIAASAMADQADVLRSMADMFSELEIQNEESANVLAK